MRFLFRKCSGGFDYFALSTHFGSSNDRVLGVVDRHYSQRQGILIVKAIGPQSGVKSPGFLGKWPKSQGFVKRVGAAIRRCGESFGGLDYPTTPGSRYLTLTPKYLLRDRDGIYGLEFQNRTQALGLEEVRAPRFPWQSPYVERLIEAPRMFGSYHRAQLGSLAPFPEMLCVILSSGSDSFGSGRRCPVASSAAGTGRRKACRV